MTQHNTIFSYITAEEANYGRPIPVNDTWEWSMSEHIRISDLYNHSQFSEGNSQSERDYKPFKNITRPILNLQHRAEDIELTDVQIYVNDPNRAHLSFLVKKYHDDVFVQEFDIDTFFDELNVSRIDFGGGLSKKRRGGREVVPLQSIAFCDQTDLLSGSIGIKHYYSPDQLLAMADVGWGSTDNGATISLDGLIALSREEKRDDNTNKQSAQTPGRYIEVYEIHGNLPKRFANPGDTSNEYETRLFICAFYQKKDSKDKQGVILYTAPERENPFKLIKRDPVYGRALGFGGAEELFDPQVWTNYDMIRIQRMLDAASTTILKAIGPNSATIVQKQKVENMDNLEIIDAGVDGDLAQVDTFPRNTRLFENSALQWEQHAKDMGAAQDPIQGKEPTSGTPFSSLAEQVRQGMGLHEYRKKQFARHIEEIYRDDFLPEIQKKITQGFRFLSTLSLDELQEIKERVVNNLVEKRVKEMIIEENKMVSNETRQLMREVMMEDFSKKGDKFFLEALAGEFKNTPLAVKIVVANKSKNLSVLADKITSIFRFVFSNPQGFAQTMQIPGMAKSFNQMLEYAGMSPIDFSGIDKLAQATQSEQPQGQPTPELPAPAMAA